MARAAADERGITLVMALLMMTVLTSVSTTTIYYTTSNVHSTGINRASTSAYDVAEAGINNALAKMFGQLNPDGSIIAGGIDPRSAAMFPSCAGAPPPAPTVLSYASAGGTASICGDYTTATFSWAIKSVGRVSSSGLPQSRTLTRAVKVIGLNNGADSGTWSRFYQDSTATCLNIDNQTFVTSVATRGNLCLTGGGGITGANTTVDVGGTITITGSNASGGPNSPSAGTGWTTPTNVYTSNNAYATNVIAAAGTGANEDATGFGFAIPATAMIAGITATVERSPGLGVNAVQTITVTGSPTGGTFKLTGTPPGGSATATISIAPTATAATVQSALVSVFGAGNVTCSGGALPAAVPCTFVGNDASTPVTLMTMSTNSLTGGSSPKAVITNTTTGYTPAVQDSSVYLLKAGVVPGGETNKAILATSWLLPEATKTYGTTSDLWGTTWTPAEVNATNFGVRFAAKNVGASSSTPQLDYISVTVTYVPAPPGIGTGPVTTPIKTLNVGGTCQYSLQAAHTPCSATDHTWATTVTTTAPAANTALVMPTVDNNYWWANAAPGPKHFCTNANPGLAANFFDNNAGSTSAPDASLTVNGEIAPAGSSYTCQVWSIPPTGGTLLGELSWNASTHVLTINGTIFVDGNFRFDTDGEIVNYRGRATLMSSKDDEIDAVVCADGDLPTPPTTFTNSCIDANTTLNNYMPNWDPTKNMMVLMSAAPNEYDQGGTSCSGNTHPQCFNGHLAGGFQGILFSTSDCLIHQNFMDSGPVICNSITLPDESGIDPTYFTFPSIGNLTDGQKYHDTTTATNFELDPGYQTG